MHESSVALRSEGQRLVGSTRHSAGSWNVRGEHDSGIAITIDNLSAKPFALSEPDALHLVAMQPSQVASACLSEPRVGVALVPVASISRLDHQFEPQGCFGIACRGAVSSVLFLSKEPIFRVIASSLPVYLTVASVTSRRLFRVLCERTYGKAPQETLDEQAAVGRLVIGDEAIILAEQADRFPHQIDLGTWWFEMTGLPFVFARWMTRASLPNCVRQEVQSWLTRCVGQFRCKEAVSYLANRVADSTRGASALAMVEYYRSLRIELGPEEEAGQALFLSFAGLPR